MASTSATPEFKLTPERKAPPSGLMPKLNSPASVFALLKYLALFVGANAVSSFLVTLTRALSGGVSVVAGKAAKRPEKRLQVYEWTGCPFCRNAREAISALDLEVEVYPTPRLTIKAYGVTSDISRYRPLVGKLGGKQQFPFLVDPNTGAQMYESGDIIKYLYEHYGPPDAQPAWILRNGGKFPFLSFALPSILRMLSFQGLETGVLRCPSKQPAELLQLWCSESNYAGRIVREALSCLELAYIWKPTPFGSSHRAPGGLLSGVYLVDPNTGFQSGFFPTVVNHLYATYATGTFPDETVRDYSTAGASASHGTSKSLASTVVESIRGLFGI